MLRLISDKRQSLKEFTENNYAQGAFFWSYLLKNREIKINGARVEKDVTIEQGDEICYYLNKKQEEKIAFYLVYEDENVLIVDKESGVNSEAVYAALYREKAEKGLQCFFIHRLDRNTKGLLAFALTKRAEDVLLQAFKERRVEKKYHALCFNEVKKQWATLTAYLKKDADKALVKLYDAPKSGTEKIITEYAVLCQNADETTKLAVTLHTGKTHQIRAHLAYIGNPIVGDMKYGDTQKNKAYKTSRQCLVAKSLRFSLDGELEYLNGKIFVSRFDAEIEK